MDGLYPLSFEMLLLPSLPTLLPAPSLPHSPGAKGRWGNAQGSLPLVPRWPTWHRTQSMLHLLGLTCMWIGYIAGGR